MAHYDIIIIGSGPAGLGAAFHLAENSDKTILLIDKAKISSGGLRNDCKQNYTYPVGFPSELWEKKTAEDLLVDVAKYLNPVYEPQGNVEIYRKRAEKLGVQLLIIDQAHVGTDKAADLIHDLTDRLRAVNVDIAFETEMLEVDYANSEIIISTPQGRHSYTDLILAPGRGGFKWLQEQMRIMKVEYSDNIVDVGIRIEAREENYPIVKDYYDPKFLFPDKVRTFCTNSGAAYVVQEKYEDYYSVNGHSLSTEKKPNGLINFSLLKTIFLTDPVVSGHQFANALGQMAMQLAGGGAMMQRIGDFRMGKRSKKENFNGDLYDFKPTLRSATPGDISLAMPSKILRDIWKSMKMLDTIVPGIMHPSSIIYYPEIKTYANRPKFMDNYFKVREHIYIIGDGGGTSRGITAAWASGIRAGTGILK